MLNTLRRSRLFENSVAMCRNLSCRHRREIDLRSQFVDTVVILFSIQLRYTNIKY